MIMPMGYRVLNNCINIIREEMNRTGAQQLLMPALIPEETYIASGRREGFGNSMFSLTDRFGKPYVLGPTHEELFAVAAGLKIHSYKDLPLNIYQFQTKFRDEARPRGGLIRAREFTMKDAYSFHITQEDLESYYKKVFDAYIRVYKRLGFKNFVAVEGDNGVMGGKISHEFMAVTPAGEDSLVICPNCHYSSNSEVAVSVKEENDHTVVGEKEEIFTGNAHSIDEVCTFLETDAKHTAKAVCYKTSEGGKLVVAFLRGDSEVNESKLAKLVKSELEYVDTEEFGLCAGNIGLIDLKVPEESYVFYDVSLKGLENFVTGSNKKDFHIKNVSMSRDLPNVNFVDIALVKAGEKCTHCGHELTLTRGIEIGNIFQLGTRYTQSMGMKINMPDGTAKEPIMGCYGIGVSRSLQSIIEEKADDKGIVWPMTIAPWQVHLCPLRMDDENVSGVSEELFKRMKNAGIEVLYDDRNVSAGIKLTDSELMGVPLRVVISPKTMAESQAEVTMRETGEKFFIPIKDLVSELKIMIEDEIHEIEKDL